MKLSVSIPDDDVAFLDAFAERAGTESRSAVVQQAIALLRSMELAPQYADAFDEWAQSDEATDWESTSGDGLGR